MAKMGRPVGSKSVRLTRKLIYRVMCKYRPTIGLTRDDIIQFLFEETGKVYARTTVFENIPIELVDKINVVREKGHPFTYFRLKKDHENLISEFYP